MKSIRAGAANALAGLKDERAATALLNALTDENAEIRWRAVTGLGNLKDAKAVAKLSEILENPLESDAVRAAAATAASAILNSKQPNPF